MAENISLHEGIIDLGQNFKEVIAGNHSHRSGSFFTAPIMYLMCKQMGVKKVVEIGVAAGSSGYWLSHAMKEMCGMYYGIEINPSYCRNVGKWMDMFEVPHTIFNLSSLDMTSQWFKENIGNVGLAYLDGNHTKEAIMHEMEVVFPFVRGGGYGYIFIHDIYTASKEGWAAVRSEYSGICDIIEVKAQSGMGILRKL